MRSSDNAPSTVHAFVQLVAGDIGVEPRRDVGVARAVAGNGQTPRQIGERRQRRNQHVEALALHQGADRKQPNLGLAAAAREWRRDPCPGARW